MKRTAKRGWLGNWWLLAAFAVTIAVYWPGLSGGFLFDDYPNIVDNRGVQPPDASMSSLVRAALSSPSSTFKRPLASLSFAANYLAAGLDPYWMKLTNVLIHLVNGLLVFWLTRALLWLGGGGGFGGRARPAAGKDARRAGLVAALVAGAWMLLPINLTAVLYVVQRMESLANAFVLLGLIGYVAGRRRMLRHTLDAAGGDELNDTAPTAALASSPARIFGRKGGFGWGGFWLCLTSLTVPTVLGLMAKETAVMLPLYALAIEWLLFGFQRAAGARKDWRIITTFVLVLALPIVIGLSWLLPGLLQPGAWATRDFTLATRLLSEARIVSDYVVWTLLPTPGALSFYHDDFHISTGLLTPWTTLASIVFLAALSALMLWLRRRQPLAALGIALFLGCQLLTGTILPLELIYEHRNYFASFGLLLAIVPLLAAPRGQTFALPRHVLLGGLLIYWTALTAFTAVAWGNPLRLAQDLAARAPQSPRAQYELGRTYIIYSHYDPASPFTAAAYAPLERSAALPRSSILPEQALIFMNARMHLPLKDAWWDSMIAKLQASRPGVQDESSLGALTQCARERRCELPPQPMLEAFMAALSHPHPRPRLLATYGDYAWNVLDDHDLGLRMTEEAVQAAPDESAYRITVIRMLVVQGHKAEAREALKQLEALNIGGQLNSRLRELRALPGLQ